MAKLNDDIYARMDADASLPPPKGYKRLGDDPEAMKDLFQMSMSDKTVKDLFEPDGTLYRAMLYEGPGGDLVLAFRGSTGIPLVSEDWRHNYVQAAGAESDHYTRAMELATLIADSPGAAGRNLTITGHSKGGGMAGAAALASGAPAVTFNPAGVHKDTVPGADLSKADRLVTDYVVDGDFLNHVVQDNRRVIHTGATGAGAFVGAKLGGPLGAVAAGGYTANKVKDTVPQNVGRRIDLPNALEKPRWYALGERMSRASGISQHGMPAVNKGLNAKTEALRQMGARLGCR